MAMRVIRPNASENGSGLLSGRDGLNEAHALKPVVGEHWREIHEPAEDYRSRLNDLIGSQATIAIRHGATRRMARETLAASASRSARNNPNPMSSHHGFSVHFPYVHLPV